MGGMDISVTSKSIYPQDVWLLACCQLANGIKVEERIFIYAYMPMPKICGYKGMHAHTRIHTYILSLSLIHTYIYIYRRKRKREEREKIGVLILHHQGAIFTALIVAHQ